MAADFSGLPAPKAFLPWQREWLLQHEPLKNASVLLQAKPGHAGRVAVWYLVQRLLCQSPQGNLACGVYDACTLLASGNHPDLRWLSRSAKQDSDGEETSLSEYIRVADVRDVIDFVHLSAHLGGARVVVVDPADALNTPAANALLKMLEEPPQGVYWLMYSERPQRLLPTIRSRCVVEALPVADTDAAVEWLAENQAADKALVLLAQAAGSPLLALDLADAQLQQERQKLLEALAEPRRWQAWALGDRIDAVAKPDRKSALTRMLANLVSWVFDLALVQQQLPPRFNPDFAAILQRLAPRVDSPALFRYHRELLKAQALVHHPLNPRWALERALIAYQELPWKI